MSANIYSITKYGNDLNKEFNDSNIKEVLTHEIKLSDEMIQSELDGHGIHEIEEYETELYPSKGSATYSKTFSHYKCFTPKFINDKEVIERKKGIRTLQRYVVSTGINIDSYGRTYKNELSYDTLSEAKNSAKEIALKNGSDVEIKQVRSGKEPSLKLGIMTLETDGKRYESDNSSEMKVYLPIYEFTFYVCSFS